MKDAATIYMENTYAGKLLIKCKRAERIGYQIGFEKGHQIGFEKGFEIGYQIGFERGKAIGEAKIIKTLLESIPTEEVAKIMNIPIEEFTRISQIQTTD